MSLRPCLPAPSRLVFTLEVLVGLGLGLAISGCQKDTDCAVWFVVCKDGQEDTLCATEDRCSTTQHCPFNQICLIGLRSPSLNAATEGRCFAKESYTCNCVDCGGTHYTVHWPDAGLPDARQPDAALPDSLTIDWANAPGQ